MRCLIKYSLAFLFISLLCISGVYGLSSSLSIKDGNAVASLYSTYNLGLNEYVQGTAMAEADNDVRVKQMLQSNGDPFYEATATNLDIGSAHVKASAINPANWWITGLCEAGTDAGHVWAYVDGVYFVDAQSIESMAEAQNIEGDNAKVGLQLTQGSLSDYSANADAWSGSDHKATASQTFSSASGDSIKVTWDAWDALNPYGQRVGGSTTITKGSVGSSSTSAEHSLGYAGSNVAINSVKGTKYSVISEAKSKMSSQKSKMGGSIYRPVKITIASSATPRTLKNQVMVARA